MTHANLPFIFPLHFELCTPLAHFAPTVHSCPKDAPEILLMIGEPVPLVLRYVFPPALSHLSTSLHAVPDIKLSVIDKFKIAVSFGTASLKSQTYVFFVNNSAFPYFLYRNIVQTAQHRKSSSSGWPRFLHY